MLSFIDTPPSDGSSPRVRGQPSLAQFHCIQVRIIPARAGPTGPVGSHRIGRQDHPRACGANHRHMRSHPFPRGSSPRVRGQPPAYAISPVPSRIIPARAGPTAWRTSPARSTTDHPRACGANEFVVDFPTLASDHPRACGANIPGSTGKSISSGSSPRVRGQQLVRDDRGGHDRIIPARAGPTAPLRTSRWDGADHPRACGANLSDVMLLAAMFGSSPRVRGQPGRLCLGPSDAGSSPRVRGQLSMRTSCSSPTRIIPARAGPTCRRKLAIGPYPDHPRACGANRRIRWRWARILGSSPRVRGQPHQSYDMASRRRIIPARAGPTSQATHIPGIGADHPRACGANFATLTGYQPSDGSSPRVRGQRSWDVAIWASMRIIPARAGPTSSLLEMRRIPTDHPRACAGPTRWPTRWEGHVSDHPRACGANLLAVRGSCQKFGSSPRVRGQPPGFISGMKRNADHPRACGANHKELLADMQKVGSSPRVRGQRHSLVVGAPRSRIIPARAGPTTP
ncbi:hypothetical protein BSCA_0823 [Bifidobacterium scardovii]|uniref:Uncharacterized protein n=1 Tax=Bifidobacterium scardovii TaxID=158787 RepID=A0A087DGW8_9BIFI|nr:hypothetical protein BSCA_0823 [Bifidobacterium scardovii]